MLITTSTVKDSPRNLRRFVEDNLANGVDHMVVFLDETQPESEAFFGRHSHVTHVVTDDAWWRGQRPEELNARQRINANLAKTALADMAWNGWLFHIDSDEVVHVDRAALEQVPDGENVVRLRPLEAVSQKHWSERPTWFKRLLRQDELALLRALGVITDGSNGNGALFHGHVEGKSGMRPASDHWFTLHHVVDATGQEFDRYTRKSLNVLHYESFSGEDFVRKWTNLLGAGPRAAFRPRREPTALALETLQRLGLSEEQAAPYFMRIFERTVEDDFETLRNLGMLEHIDPRKGTHVPQALPGDQRDALRRRMVDLSKLPPKDFHPPAPRSDHAPVGEGPKGRGLFRRK